MGNTVFFSHTDNYYADTAGSGVPAPPAYSPTPPTTNAFPTQVTQPILGTTTTGYYYGSGSLALSTDINNRTTYFHYQDPLNRSTRVFLPAGSYRTTTYNSPTQITNSIYGGTTIQTQKTVNPSTRTTTGTLLTDPSGETYTNSVLDTSGRLQNVTNPFRTGDTVYSKSIEYDGLDRVKKVTLQDNNFTETFYGSSVGSGGGITAQLCTSGDYDLGFPGLAYPVLQKDEAGKKRQAWTDALGRLIEVNEPDASGALTLKTCYQYNVLGSLIMVTQGVQIRTMAYDALGRLTTETTPEGGTINVYYKTAGNALCAGNPSAVCRATDARSITTTFTYDALDRLTGKSYSNGEPAVTYSNKVREIQQSYRYQAASHSFLGFGSIFLAFAWISGLALAWSRAEWSCPAC